MGDCVVLSGGAGTAGGSGGGRSCVGMGMRRNGDGSDFRNGGASKWRWFGMGMGRNAAVHPPWAPWLSFVFVHSQPEHREEALVFPVTRERDDCN